MNKEQSLLVFFVTNNYLPYAGGVVSSIEAFRKELTLLGHKVIVITLDFESSKTKKSEPHIIRLFCPLKWTYKNNRLALPLYPKWELDELIKNYKPTLIHSHHPFLLGKTALSLAQKYNLPLIFTYHTMYEYYSHYIPFIGTFIRPFIKKYVTWYCQKVSAIIAPSTLIKDSLRNQKIRPPIYTVPSGIQPVFVHAKPSPTIHSPCRLLFVGRFVKEKNIHFLLDVFTLLPKKQFHLTLIGHGYLYDELRKYAYNVCYLHQDEITFSYKPSKYTLAQEYQNADLFIMASQYETQGIVIAEAMASGKPVIALGGIGALEGVVHNHNGFIVQSKEDMIIKIKQLVSNQALYKKMSNNAHQTALAYTTSATTQKLVTVYRHFTDYSMRNDHLPNNL
ncbi:MAG: glycosyltransferase [Candidatus Babeliales bacterium]